MLSQHAACAAVTIIARAYHGVADVRTGCPPNGFEKDGKCVCKDTDRWTGDACCPPNGYYDWGAGKCSCKSTDNWTGDACCHQTAALTGEQTAVCAMMASIGTEVHVSVKVGVFVVYTCTLVWCGPWTLVWHQAQVELCQDRAPTQVGGLASCFGKSEPHAPHTRCQ